MSVTDRSIEKLVANLLRLGVTLAGAVVAVGGAVYLMRHASDIPNYRVFRELPASDRLLPNIVENAMHGSARAIIQLGIGILIMTPIARVALSLIGFAMERDRQYVVITTIVLVVLMYGLASGAIRG